METNFLNVFIEQNKTLAKTLCIKSQTSIDLINDRIVLLYGDSAVDTYDPRSWRYYLNVSGEYHSLDEEMVVISLDTLEPILFSKANLSIHKSTAENYQYGTRYYYALVDKYPNQEQLILGILYPADIDKAIESPNGSILSYPSYLVESQEITLMEELEDFIIRYIDRWDIPAFGIAEDLYPAAQHAILYLNVYLKLINLRWKRCHTNEVHSFHVQQFLASHGRLDRFMPYMTLKQSLFLYRNLRYIERHSGYVEQFETLVDKFLTDRRIPLNEFSVRQLSSFDNKYYPEISIRRKPVNAQYNVPEKDYFDLSVLYDKERPLVYGNTSYIEDNLQRIEYLFKNSDSSVMQSKDLESSMVDYNDAVPDPLETVLLRQWMSMSMNGHYNAVITFVDPVSLEERTISAKDASIYFFYIFLYSINVQITEVPTYAIIKARKYLLPSIEELVSITDKDYYDFSKIAESLLLRQPEMTVCYSTDSFFNLSNRIYEESLTQWKQTSQEHDLFKRGYLDNMILQLYEDQIIDMPSDGLTMDEWLASRNLPIYNYTYEDAQLLLKEIFMQSTGLTIDNTKLLANIQKAMIAILKQLCSYSIQFITEINKSAIRPLNWSAIRLGNIRSNINDYHYLRTNVRVYDNHGKLNSESNLLVNPTIAFDQKITVIANNLSIDISPIAELEVSTIQNVLSDISARYVNYSYDIYDPVISRNSPFVGFEYFNNLTDDQKNQLKSIF